MSKHDGWVTKGPTGHLYPEDFRETRKEVIRCFLGSLPLKSWRSYKKEGWKIVKAKLTEVK